MERRTMWKRFLSVILSVTMLAGVITISEPQQVEAAEQVVWKEDFEDSSLLTTHSGSLTQSIATAGSNHYLSLAGYSSTIIKTGGIAVEVGKTYNFSYKVNISNLSSDFYFYPWIQEWNVTNGAESDFAVNTDWAPNTARLQAATEGWTTVTIEYTPTSGKNYVQFFFEEAWGGSADVLLDDLTLSEVIAEKEAVDSVISYNGIEKEKYLKLSGYQSSIIKTNGIAVADDTTYTLSYKVNISNLSSNFYFYPWIQEWNVTNGAESGYAVNTNWAPDTARLQASTGGWTTVTIEYTPTSGKNYVQFFFEEAWGGSADVLLDDITLTASGASPVWNETFDSTKGFTVHSGSPSQSIEANETWVLDATGLDSIATTTFTANVVIDGAGVTIPILKDGSQLKVPETYFSTINKSAGVPTTSFSIAEGTLIVEADSSDDWAKVAGGDRIKVTKALNLAYVDGNWVSVAKTNTTITYDEIDSSTYLKLTGYQSSIIKTNGIAVADDTTYTLSYKVNISNLSSNFYFYPWIQEWNVTNGAESGYAVNTDWAPDTARLQASTGGWTTVTIEYTPTSGKNYVQFFFEEAWGGSADVLLDDITLTASGASPVWNETFDSTKGFTVHSGSPSQSIVEEENWYFDATNLDALTGQYYAVAAQIDGVVSTVVMEKYNSQFVVWPGWFSLMNSTATTPTQSFEIVAGATIYQVTSSGWTAVAGGDEMTVLKNLRVVKDDEGNWAMEAAKVYDITFGYDSVDSEGNWLLSADSYETSDSYYKIEVLVDGVEEDVLIENTDSIFYIYDWFFTYLGGG